MSENNKLTREEAVRSLSDDELKGVAGGGENSLLVDLVDLNTVCMYGLTTFNGDALRKCGEPDPGQPNTGQGALCRYLNILKMNPNLTMLLCEWRAKHQ